ncbi:MAG: glycosyltransferase family 2 protein [Anaerolineales bacterium]|nr:glycosyltransferase family 2 protein [Anaerolineales bacterium]
MKYEISGVIALIPAWNEGERLEPILRQTQEYLPVLVVDDGSIDDTVAVARRCGAIVVEHPHNQGKGVALITGFNWALEHGYDAVMTLDADGQHDPADIPAFMDVYQHGDAPLIIGRRDFSKMPFPRLYTNPFGSWLLSRALGRKIDDNQSGFRIYRRSLLETVELTTSGFELEVEVIMEAVVRGMDIDWVDIKTIYDIDKVSYFHPIRDSIIFLGMVRRAHQYRKRFPEG